MFQDALLESRGLITTRSRYFSVVGFLLNSFILLALILWPLMHPLALPKQALSMLLVAPSPPAPAATITRTAAATVMKASSLAAQLLAPSRIPSRLAAIVEAAPSAPGSEMAGMPGGTAAPGLGGLLDSAGAGPRAVVTVARPKKVAISSGVMAGNKVAGASPIYPAIAKSARVAGTVVLAATISRTGAIENLRVMSGPPLLTASALDAVSRWRYRPYLLNGVPVEVDTTINVIFSLGS